MKPLLSGPTLAIVKILRLAERIIAAWQDEPRPAHSGESIAYYQHVERKDGEPWSV